MSLNHIPTAILQNIFKFLPRKSLSRCSRVNRSWNAIAQPELWRHVQFSIDMGRTKAAKKLIVALSKGIVKFDRLADTMHLELDFESDDPDMRWARNYWFLRRHLTNALPRLQTLSVTFPSQWNLSRFDTKKRSESAEATLADMQVFIRELAQKCQHLRVSYSPGAMDDAEMDPDEDEDGDSIPLFPHVWKLEDIVTDLEFYISPFTDKIPSFQAMRQLKTLNLHSIPEFYGIAGHDGTWVDLRNCPIETLRLGHFSTPHQIHFPNTLTSLCIDTTPWICTAIHTGFMRAPHLQHLRLISDSELDIKWDNEDFKTFPSQRPNVVSTKLQSLQIDGCHFPPVFIEWISTTCTQLSSLSFSLPLRGSKFTKHFTNDKSTLSYLKHSTNERYSGCVSDDYWRAFFRGLPSDQLHTVFFTQRCTCFTELSLSDECYCDTRGWNLKELSRGEATRESRTSAGMVIVQQHGSGILMRKAIMSGKDQLVTTPHGGYNVVVYPVPNEVNEMTSGMQVDTWNGILRYWKWSKVQ